MLPEEKNLPTNPILKKNKLVADSFVIAGIVLVVMSVIIGVKIFFPVVREEIGYQLYQKTLSSEKNGVNEPQKTLDPADKDFGIVIPKIRANAKVIPEVDPLNPAVYQRALTKGVAQAKGASYPGEGGNIFIFAHSSADILEANKYNAIFYLLSKLEKDDEIDMYYKNQKYIYKVTERKTVNADEVKYLEQTDTEQLTLMTCWPPGTTLKRLVVIANLAEEQLD
jgi:LPXTG-site transpeptidase (sortase) family protein